MPVHIGPSERMRLPTILWLTRLLRAPDVRIAHIHLDYVGRWATSLDEVAAAAPGDWDVLQARAAVFLDLLFFRSKTMGRERLGL